MNEELEVTVIVRQIKKAKRSLSDIRDSVDPVSPTAEILVKVENFLKDSEKEAIQQLNKSGNEGKVSFFTRCTTALLPAIQLLTVMAKAGRAVSQLLEKN